MDEEVEQESELEPTEPFLIQVDHITDDRYGQAYTVNAYSDGGQLSANQKGVGSTHGGTWGCVWTDRDDNRIQEAHGTVLPNKSVGRMGVTNNDSEMIAALIALDNLPDDWKGTFHCDSLVTLARIKELSPHKEHRPDRINNLPWSESDKVEMRNKEREKKRGELVGKMGVEIVETLEAILWRLGSFKIRHLKGHPTEESLANGVSPEGRAVSKWNKRCDDMANESKKLYFKKLVESQTSESESEVVGEKDCIP
jgi:ribonuclease HI